MIKKNKNKNKMRLKSAFRWAILFSLILIIIMTVVGNGEALTELEKFYGQGAYYDYRNNCIWVKNANGDYGRLSILKGGSADSAKNYSYLGKEQIKDVTGRVAEGASWGLLSKAVGYSVVAGLLTYGVIEGSKWLADKVVDYLTEGDPTIDQVLTVRPDGSQYYNFTIDKTVPKSPPCQYVYPVDAQYSPPYSYIGHFTESADAYNAIQAMKSSLGCEYGQSCSCMLGSTTQCSGVCHGYYIARVGPTQNQNCQKVQYWDTYGQTIMETQKLPLTESDVNNVLDQVPVQTYDNLMTDLLNNLGMNLSKMTEADLALSQQIAELINNLQGTGNVIQDKNASEPKTAEEILNEQQQQDEERTKILGSELLTGIYQYVKAIYEKLFGNVNETYPTNTFQQPETQTETRSIKPLYDTFMNGISNMPMLSFLATMKNYIVCSGSCADYSVVVVNGITKSNVSPSSNAICDNSQIFSYMGDVLLTLVTISMIIFLIA